MSNIAEILGLLIEWDDQILSSKHRAHPGNRSHHRLLASTNAHAVVANHWGFDDYAGNSHLAYCPIA